jgi:hypothetical protein
LVAHRDAVVSSAFFFRNISRSVPKTGLSNEKDKPLNESEGDMSQGTTRSYGAVQVGEQGKSWTGSTGSASAEPRAATSAGMPKETKSGRFLCERCRRRYDRKGDCPRCAEEPLLDLADDDMRLMIDEQDSTRRNRRFSAIVMICAVVLAPVTFLVWQIIGMFLGIGFGVMATFGLSKLINKIDKIRDKPLILSREEIERFQGAA